jgi:hypothetical protein
MVCNCGEENQRPFPANNSFSVFVSKSKDTTPLEWKESTLYVCIGCGATGGQVPDALLQKLHDAAGENLTRA